MAEAGILSEDDPIELLDGEIIEMAPIGDRHYISVLRSSNTFKDRLRNRALVSVQSPIRLSSGSEPEPDIVLLRPRDDFYAAVGIPGPEDVLLIVEVADNTLRYDRNVKLRFYAESGIPEVWIVDLKGDRILVFSEPQAITYGYASVVARGGTLAPRAFPDLSVSADDLLG
jgi:Uma2 family endonuclease